jgi:rfaE bifunctional protein nucleotidyltransferase chain/domain
MGQFFSDKAELIQNLNTIRKDKKVVFTNGCFDLLHVGHIRYLKEARSKGDILIVALNSDASVKRLKGPTRPIQNETDRSEILAALESVSATVIFTEDTPEIIIKLIKPDILVKGGDWKIDQIVGGEFVQSYGGQVLSLLFIDGKSTTSIVSKIEKS